MKRIVFMGTPDYATIIFEQLLQSNYNIVALFTQQDKPIGRKQTITPPHIKQFAINNNINIPIFQPLTLKDPQVWQQIKDLKPDIIITDIRMPNMSGNDLVDKIKQIDPNMPIVVVSGHGRLIKKTNKADVFLEKPINFIRLVTEIHKLLKK